MKSNLHSARTRELRPAAYGTGDLHSARFPNGPARRPHRMRPMQSASMGTSVCARFGRRRVGSMLMG